MPQSDFILIGVIALLTLGLVYSLWRGWRAHEVDWGAPWTNIIDGWMRLFCRGYHRLHYDAVELPAEGPAIVVSNHISGLDPFLMLTASNRPLHFLIATEQYHRFGLTWLFRRAGCIPVDRERRPEKALFHALRALENGAVVALYPHGGIHLDQDPPRRLKRGVARLASLTGAPVYPLRITGVQGAGHVVSGVVRRGQPRLQAFPPMVCTAEDENAFLERLAAILEGRPD